MGKLAFVFPGQGAQRPGMCKDIFDARGSAKALLRKAENLRGGVSSLMFRGAKEQLDITLNAQPCLFLADLACAMALAEALGEKGVFAEGAAGFSLGEVPAACFAGIMNEEQAFGFVLRRAEAMQKCAKARKGAMYAVLGLSAEDVESLCAEVGRAFPANYNCPGQTVAACADEASGALIRAVAERGGKAVKLATNGAFHSPFMDDASEEMAAFLTNMNFAAPRIPLYANVTARVYGDPAALLAKQVNSPVLWQKTIENMIADGFDAFAETGPGKTLTGLIKKISPDVKTYNVWDVPSLENTVKEYIC